MSLDVAHSLADIFDLDRELLDKNKGVPIEINKKLFIQELDIQEEIQRYWGDVHKYLSSILYTTGLDECCTERRGTQCVWRTRQCLQLRLAKL